MVFVNLIYFYLMKPIKSMHIYSNTSTNKTYICIHLITLFGFKLFPYLAF